MIRCNDWAQVGKIGALFAKKTVALPRSCRLPTAAGQISLIPEQAQDGDTTERQRQLPSISNTPVGIECRVTRQDSVGWAAMARQLRAGNPTASRHPARAGQTELPAEQCERSPAAKHWWLSALTPNFPEAPPCTDNLACYGHALEGPWEEQTICFKYLALAQGNADQYR